MARHNRDARGEDQRGETWDVSYQPDWLRLIKVTRLLDTGRQSTKTLFKNPAKRQQPPAQRVRTRIVSKDQNVSFEVELDDPQGVVRRVIVETAPFGADGPLTFSIDAQAPPKRRGG